MNVARIMGSTRTLNAPAGWDKDSDGPCLGLPIRDQALIGGVNVMVSAWQPSDNEVEALRQGATLQLHVVGTAHPPVMLVVGEPPEITEAEVDAEIARILAMSEQEILAMSTPIDLGLGRLMKSHMSMVLKVAEERRRDEKADADRDRLAARVDELEAALLPFAHYAEQHGHLDHAEGEIGEIYRGAFRVSISYRALREAARALHADGARS